MNGIGDLVATLVADTKQWQSGLSSAKSGLASFAKSAAVSLAGVAASFATIDFAKSAVFAAEEDIRATKKLQGVFEATGFSAGVTTERVSELATELQRLTGIEDGATMSAAALLATFDNIKGDDFERALRLSHDLAVVWEVDLLSAVKKLGRQLKELRPEEVSEKLSALEHRFAGAAEKSVSSTTKISNAIGDLKEQIGNELLPVVDLIADHGVPNINRLGDAFYASGLRISPFLHQARAVRDFLKELPTESVTMDMGFMDDKAPVANLGLPSAPEFDNGAKGRDEAFKRRIEDMRNQADKLRGEATNAEIAFREALQQGFSPEQAKEIEEQVRLLDGLKELKRQDEEAAREAEKKKAADAPDSGFAALQKGSAEAASAVLTAMRGGNDKALKAAEENVVQNEDIKVLLGDMRDAIKGGGVALYAGSLT